MDIKPKAASEEHESIMFYQWAKFQPGDENLFVHWAIRDFLVNSYFYTQDTALLIIVSMGEVIV
jgi:hypothetical protein